MATRGLSLRLILAVLTSVVVLLALVVSGTLVALTTLLHRTTSSAATSVESVRVAHEAEIDLLLHVRTGDALLQRNLEERIRTKLVDARRLVTSPYERRVVDAADAQASAYIAAARDPQSTAETLIARQQAAYASLEALVRVNLQNARDAYAASALWDERADYLGLGVGGLLIVVAASVLLWLQRRAFAPVFSLVVAMERFGKGNREARAPETGPAELREMSRRFNDMAEALAAQRQAQIAFLGGVAHDLRTPLSVLKLSIALVPPDRPLPPERRVRQVIEKIDRQITRLERMAGDFLDITNIEAGALELKLDKHDARQLVGAVVELFRGTSPEPRLRVSVPDQSVDLHCDQLRIEQVLTNLVSNALKYSPAASPIEVAVERIGDEVVFRVADHGIGISEAERQHVFEPFHRVGASKDKVAGVGLGLFVVRRIVEAHGGTIDVESTPGEGSTFSVRLPAQGRAVRRAERGGQDAPRLTN